MKIRTITSFVYIDPNNTLEEIKTILSNAASLNYKVKKTFEMHGYEVQTTRITTNPFEDYCGDTKDKILEKIQKISEIVSGLEVSYFSLGGAQTKVGNECIHDILKLNDHFSICTLLDSHTENLNEMMTLSAHNALRLSKETEGGLGNFNYTVCTCCKPFIPFYPASYSSFCDSFKEGKNLNTVCFAIGTENGNDCNEILHTVTSLTEAKESLLTHLQEEYSKIESIALKLESNECVYLGIDTSFNPGLSEAGSIAHAIETLLYNIQSHSDKSFHLGDVGSLSACRILTSVCDSLNIKKTGYNGLMLPVLEDTVLAKRYGEGRISVPSLLSFSSVCGVGIDTLPVPCDSSPTSLVFTYMDVYSLATKWNKQLSCRFLICPDVYNGEISTFSSPNLTNCVLHSLE